MSNKKPLESPSKLYKNLKEKMETLERIELVELVNCIRPSNQIVETNKFINLRQNNLDYNPKIKSLFKIKKYVISNEENLQRFKQLNGFRVLLELLETKDVHVKIINLIISILANSAMHKDIRNKLLEYNILNNIYYQISKTEDYNILCRALRLIANLSYSVPLSKDKIYYNILHKVIQIIDTTNCKNTIICGIRAVKYMWLWNFKKIQDYISSQSGINVILNKIITLNDNPAVILAHLNVISTMLNCNVRKFSGGILYQHFAWLLNLLEHATYHDIVMHIVGKVTCSDPSRLYELCKTPLVDTMISLLNPIVINSKTVQYMKILCLLSKEHTGRQKIILNPLGISTMLSYLDLDSDNYDEENDNIEKDNDKIEKDNDKIDNDSDNILREELSGEKTVDIDDDVDSNSDNISVEFSGARSVDFDDDLVDDDDEEKMAKEIIDNIEEDDKKVQSNETLDDKIKKDESENIIEKNITEMKIFKNINKRNINQMHFHILQGINNYQYVDNGLEKFMSQDLIKKLIKLLGKEITKYEFKHTTPMYKNTDQQGSSSKNDKTKSFNVGNLSPLSPNYYGGSMSPSTSSNYSPNRSPSPGPSNAASPSSYVKTYNESDDDSQSVYSPLMMDFSDDAHSLSNDYDDDGDEESIHSTNNIQEETTSIQDDDIRLDMYIIRILLYLSYYMKNLERQTKYLNKLCHQSTWIVLLDYILKMEEPECRRNISKVLVIMCERRIFLRTLIANNFVLDVHSKLCRLKHNLKCIFCRTVWLYGQHIVKQFAVECNNHFGYEEIMFQYKKQMNEKSKMNQIIYMIPYLLKDNDKIHRLLFGDDDIFNKLLNALDIDEDEADEERKQCQTEAIISISEFFNPIHLNELKFMKLCTGCSAKRSITYEGDITFILDDETIIKTNKQLLINESEYFETMLSGRFKEASNSIEHIKLSNISSACFNYLIRILSCSKFCTCLLPTNNINIYFELLVKTDEYLLSNINYQLINVLFEYIEIINHKNIYNCYKFCLKYNNYFEYCFNNYKYSIQKNNNSKRIKLDDSVKEDSSANELKYFNDEDFIELLLRKTFTLTDKIDYNIIIKTVKQIIKSKTEDDENVLIKFKKDVYDYIKNILKIPRKKIV